MSLCLIGSLPACGTTEPRVITVYETKEVFRDRYIPIKPESLVPVEIYEPPANPDTIDLRTAYLVNKESAKTCNGQLAEIAKQGKP
jgi:hypothetical protein